MAHPKLPREPVEEEGLNPACPMVTLVLLSLTKFIPSRMICPGTSRELSFAFPTSYLILPGQMWMEN